LGRAGLQTKGGGSVGRFCWVVGFGGRWCLHGEYLIMTSREEKEEEEEEERNVVSECVFSL